ncbi:MAG: peroxide stress protein YaaA [Rickettsiaceae bacterium]
MISIISPAKSMDFSPIDSSVVSTDLEELVETTSILNELKTFSSEDIKKLMSVSDKIAMLNYDRYQSYEKLPEKQALFAYDGDVYNNIGKESMTQAMLAFAQKHVRIISGLYGLLKPLDRIRAYRLEMSIKLPLAAPQGLDKFWQNVISQKINEELEKHEHKFLINLASKEYFAAINERLLRFPVINLHFFEWRKGELKNIALNSKRARGMAAGYIIKNAIDDPESIKGFKASGYSFESSKSSVSDYVFIKES